jgi:broad specificity phosphatase PhoE
MGCRSLRGPHPAGATTVYVVRHAEKRDQSTNALLSSAGHRRAQALAEKMRKVPLVAIYATQYRRTQQTVQPTADAIGLDVQVTRERPRRLASRILREHRGHPVLVAGHSNTLAELLIALGVAKRVKLRSQDYGDLFVVSHKKDGESILDHRRFGD